MKNILCIGAGYVGGPTMAMMPGIVLSMRLWWSISMKPAFVPGNQTSFQSTNRAWTK